MGPARDSSSTVWSFPKLNGTNYYTWSENMKDALEARGLWCSHIEIEAPPPPKPSIHPPGKKSVDPKTPKKPTQGSTIPEMPVKSRSRVDVDNAGDDPTDGNTTSMMVSLGLDEAAEDDDAYMYTAVYTQWEKRWEKYNTWKVNDSAAMGWMKGALEPTQWPHVTAAKTAKEMWDLLYELYFVSRKGTQLHFHIWDLWHQTWDESATTMTQFIGKMLELRQRILDCGEEIGDRLLIQAIFMALPHTTDWRLLRASMFRRGSDLTLNEVITELNAEYDRLQQDKTVEERGKKGGELALYSSGGGSQSGGGKKSEKKSKRKPKPDDECFDCKAKGVWRGHPDCPNPKRKGGCKTQAGGAANIAVDGLKSLGEREVGKVYMAVEGNVGSGLILDCGATSHMFAEKRYFSTMTPETSGEYVTVGGNNRVPVDGRGSVRFRANLDDGILTVTLNNALFLPGLGANLVSLGALHREGASVESFRGGLKVSLDGEDLFRAVMGGGSGTLYYIDCAEGIQESALIASSGSMRLWHRRLGHISPIMIRNMSRKEMVKGLDIKSPEIDHLCNGCMHGKSHKLPLPGSSDTKYSKMELLVMNLTEPMSVPTWDGYRYALVVIEEEVGVAVRDAVVMLERQSGKKVLRLRSDNGTEFVNSAMRAFCQKNGIIHETTDPYLPEQNGIAERALVIYFETVRCMLHFSSVDLRYWGEAFMYAMNIRTITATSGLDGVVPFETWTGRKPDVSHLRIFGSKGWVHVPKQNDETKGYRLENLERVEGSSNFITVGGHNRVQVEGRGSVRFYARLKSTVVPVILNDVLFIPKLGVNLVSLGALQEGGATVQSFAGGLSVRSGDEELFRAVMGGDGGTLYRTDSTSMIPAAIAIMSRQGMVKGLKVDAPVVYDHLCSGCMHGKSHKLPLPSASSTSYAKMDPVVMDLTGPICRYPVGRLLKTKEEVGVAVRDIVAMLDRQLGVKAMTAFCLRNEILHETTNPYLPEQNGIAERVIAVLFEMVRCMLHSANVDLRYWGEAFIDLAVVEVPQVRATSEEIGSLVEEAIRTDAVRPRPDAVTVASSPTPITQLSPPSTPPPSDHGVDVSATAVDDNYRGLFSLSSI
ncbi:hypothetical protein NP233_g10170 [Leucocoprinus birnbaumii]|uniref:Integrase catalytic domain-containing protein n=1 Tax=Leucocoprinus birnbaumii TaxID=56174 RepID=A0AAD5VIS0_9AGAR|nr:hypothetical protein NP233_g10170 [Leucocoprinus birnbaumii]